MQHPLTLLAILMATSIPSRPLLACTMAPEKPVEIENEFEIEIEYDGYEDDRDVLQYEVEIEVEVFAPNQQVQCQCALGLGNLTWDLPASVDVTQAVVAIRGENEEDLDAFADFERDTLVEQTVLQLSPDLNGALAFGFSQQVSPFELPPLQANDTLALSFKLEFDPDHFDLINGAPILFAAGSNEAGHELSVFEGYQPVLNLPFPIDAPAFGDFDRNGLVDRSDLDFVCSGVAQGLTAAAYDLDGDGLVSPADVQLLMSRLDVIPGDTDLDGQVNFADFLTLSASFGKAGPFSQGDFDCSGSVEFGDFLVLSQNFGASSAVSVPEPAAHGTVIGLLGSLVVMRRRRAFDARRPTK